MLSHDDESPQQLGRGHTSMLAHKVTSRDEFIQHQSTFDAASGNATGKQYFRDEGHSRHAAVAVRKNGRCGDRQVVPAHPGGARPRVGGAVGARRKYGSPGDDSATGAPGDRIGSGGTGGCGRRPTTDQSVQQESVMQITKCRFTGAARMVPSSAPVPTRPVLPLIFTFKKSELI
jgi:hypothetical protein